MRTMQIQHHSVVLRDLLLLQVPETTKLVATVQLLDQPQIETELFPTAVLRFSWPSDSDLDVKSVIRRTADTYTKANLLTYKMVTSSRHRSVFGSSMLHTKTTTLTLTHGGIRTSDNGEPIPSSLPYASVHVSDNVYSISTDNGLDFSVLKNGEEVAGKLPSAGFALGIMSSYVLQEFAHRGNATSEQTATKKLTDDFIYAVAQTLAEGGQLNDVAMQHLTNFVEMATNKDFSVGKGA